MIIDQSSLEKSPAVRSLQGRAMALSIMAIGIGAAVVFTGVAALKGRLASWGPNQSFYVGASAWFAVMGLLLFRVKPRYAGQVCIDSEGVQFRGGTLRDWGLRWDDPEFRISFRVRGEVPGGSAKGALPTVALAKPGTSLLTAEAYQAILRKASEVGLKVDTVSRNSRGWGQTRVRRN